MQIVSGNEHVTFSYDQARAAISEIEAAISQEQLKSEDKDAALEMLTEIRDKITQEKKPGVIKALLVGLKDFLINAGSSLAAGLIQTNIQGLLKKQHGRMVYHLMRSFFCRVSFCFTTFTGCRCRT